MFVSGTFTAEYNFFVWKIFFPARECISIFAKWNEWIFFSGTNNNAYNGNGGAGNGGYGGHGGSGGYGMDLFYCFIFKIHQQKFISHIETPFILIKFTQNTFRKKMRKLLISWLIIHFPILEGGSGGNGGNGGKFSKIKHKNHLEFIYS